MSEQYDRQSERPSVREAAREYIRRGWVPIPLRTREKTPVRAGWRDLRIREESIIAHFLPPNNIGILTGVASGAAGGGYLVDVDCDAREAVEAAAALLPPTGRVHGRHRKPASHYWYLVDAPLRTTKFAFAGGSLGTEVPEHADAGLKSPPTAGGSADLSPSAPCAGSSLPRPPAAARQPSHSGMLVELRADGCQTMAPPSMHPSGELVRWEREGEPGRVSSDELLRAVGKVAAAALLARHWPGQGTRDEAALALAGMLLRGGWEAEETDEFVRVVARVAGDEEWKKRAKGAQTAWTLAAGERVTGATRLAQLLVDGERVVGKAREWLGLECRVGGAEPARGGALFSPHSLLSQAHAYPDPPRQEVYTGVAGELTRLIAPHTEADPVAVLAQFLAVVGNIAGRRVYFAAEEDRHYPNLFLVLVGQTSKGRKGTSWGQAVRPLKDLCPQAEAWLAKHITSGLSSGEGLIYLLRDGASDGDEDESSSSDEPDTPTKALKKRLLVRESEFVGVLKMFQREGNTLSAVLRQAWDGDTLGVITKKSKARARLAHVSVVGHITVEELLRSLSQTEAANGLGNRFLWFCTRRSKLLPDGGRLSSVDFVAVRERLRAVFAFLDAIDPEHPVELTRDGAARALWHAEYPRLSAGSPGLVGALTGRAEAQVMRLACVYALLDCSRVIRVEHLRAAIALWDYAEASVRAIFGEQLGDPVADTILVALRNAPDGLTRAEISHLFARHAAVAEIARALGVLHGRGLTRVVTQPTDGRPAERWYASERSERSERSSTRAATGEGGAA